MTDTLACPSTNNQHTELKKLQHKVRWSTGR